MTMSWTLPLLLALPMVGIAAELTPAEQAAIASFQSVTGGSAKVETVFAGPSGLIGLEIGLPDKKHGVVWATSDGRYILSGSLYSPSRVDLTAVYVRKANGLDAMTLTDDEVSALPTLVTQTTGTGAPETWIITDPMCPPCRAEYADLTRRKGTVHWLLSDAVGGDTSRAIASAVITGKMTLADAMTHPGTKANEAPDARASDRVNLVDTLVQRLGFGQPRLPISVRQENNQYVASIGFEATQP